MTIDLNALRAMRKNAGSNLTKITAALEKSESKGYNNVDDRFWKAAIDKAGNGSAVIRFLPALKDGDMPWVKLYSHGFKNEATGKWFIENCPTTINLPSPVVEHCNTLYATKLKSDEEIAKSRKRRLSYISNVLIIKDPANPENEGKVKLFKYGKKLHDKILDKLSPQFADDEACEVFDPFVGANFRLRIAKVDGYSNTDKSMFDSPSEISSDENEMVRILNERHNLDEFIAPSQFKSYEELSKKLEQVLAGPSGVAHKKASDFILADEDEKPAAKAQPAPAKAKSEPPIKALKPPAKTEDEDDLSFFESLVNED